MILHDISRGTLGSPPYPGDPAPRLTPLSRISEDGTCNLSMLSACVHAATHADAPLHFIEGAESVDMLPLEPFVGPCRVASSVDDAPCVRLLLRAGTPLTPENAARLWSIGVRMVGVEEQSIGGAETHRAFLGMGFAVLEGLNLGNVADGEYFLCAAPILIEGSDGAFVRAVLIEWR